ncbi:MAG: ribulose-bisphosphate carboxylase large subunit [Candidatus Methanofastidiosum sp.]|nr:ribulose-bisphosphate carboxylase large subunit [Methanofastidiosum sp.]
MDFVRIGEDIDKDFYLIADFYIETDDVIKNAGELAKESSNGTWTPLKTSKGYASSLSAFVFYAKELYEIEDNKAAYIKVAYPIELFEDNSVPQILSDIAGNILGMKIIPKARLIDVDMPQKYIKTFKGPEYGIEGVRKYMKTDKTRRPHIGTIVKPKVGLNPEDTASLSYESWYGGCDFVKDDENLTNQRFCPFEDRVIKVLDALDRAESETGEKKLYAPNITGVNMTERAQFVKDHGGACIMVDILVAGFSKVQEIRDQGFKMIIHGHRAMHAAITRNERQGISMPVLSLLSRLAGIDQLHVGSVVGKMEGEIEEVLKNKEKIVSDLFGLNPCFPVNSGGLHPGHIPAIVQFMGDDTIVQAGGGIHGHPDGTIKGAAAMRQAVDAVMEGISLPEYAKTHEELRKALEKWK